MIKGIFCVDKAGGFSKDGIIPWHDGDDMKHFVDITYDGVVVMGHNTWNSLPFKLAGRVNIVLARSDIVGKQPDQIYYNAIDLVRALNGIKNDKIFVIGGLEILNLFINMKLINTIYLTVLNQEYECDKFLRPELLIRFKVIGQTPITNGMIYQYQYMNSSEIRYINLCSDILSQSNWQPNRTGIKTKVIFCPTHLRFDLTGHTFPLLTTRSMPLRQIFEELLWVIRGQSDVKILQKKNIRVWDQNVTKEFIKSQKLEIDLTEGETGVSYGFNMRHYGGNFIRVKRIKQDAEKQKEIDEIDRKIKGDDYVETVIDQIISGIDDIDKEVGFDQLNYVIEQLRLGYDNRRLIINLWNPSAMKQTPLPPCMFCYQFYLEGDQLSLRAITRSSDVPIGLPWNIAFAALFLKLIANHIDLKPKQLIMDLGNAHVYENQVEGLEQLFARLPSYFPKLIIKNKKANIEEYEFEDLELLHYHPQTPIKMPCN